MPRALPSPRLRFTRSARNQPRATTFRTPPMTLSVSEWETAEPLCTKTGQPGDAANILAQGEGVVFKKREARTPTDRRKKR